MQITVTNHTEAMEMHHIAMALQRIAAERGYKAPVETDRTHPTTSVSFTEHVQEGIADAEAGNLIPLDEVAAKWGATSLSSENAQYDHDLTDSTFLGSALITIHPPGLTIDPIAALPERAIDDRLDSSGLPWDARIHAGSRERNTDGSWRVRRRPKGVEEAEWDATLARVTAELRDLMSIPVSPGAVADAATETREMIEALGDTLVGDTKAQYQALLAGGVVDPVDMDKLIITRETPVIAPPVVLPPIVLPPVIETVNTETGEIVTPPITTDKPAIETFAQLMVWLTGHTPKDEAAKPPFVTRVNEILAANQLTTLQQLGQRAELIPQVLAQFREAFGE